MLRWQTFLDSSIVLLIAFVVEGLYTNYFGSFDTCAHDRLSHGDFWSKTTSSILLSATMLFIAILLVMIGSWPSSKQKRFGVEANWPSVYNVAFMTIWFCSTLCVCIELKVLLGDDTCSKPGNFNSVSGHYNFHLYYLLAIPFAAARIKQQRQTLSVFDIFTLNLPFVFEKLRTRTKLFFTVYVLLILTSVSTMYRTYTGGYHTLHQIYLGSLLAIASHRISATFLDEVYAGGMKRITASCIVIPIFAVVFAQNVIHNRNPYSNIEMVMIAIAVLLLFATPSKADAFIGERMKNKKQANESEKKPPKSTSATRHTAVSSPKSSSPKQANSNLTRRKA